MLYFYSCITILKIMYHSIEVSTLNCWLPSASPQFTMFGHIMKCSNAPNINCLCHNICPVSHTLFCSKRVGGGGGLYVQRVSTLYIWRWIKLLVRMPRQSACVIYVYVKSYIWGAWEKLSVLSTVATCLNHALGVKELSLTRQFDLHIFYWM